MAWPKIMSGDKTPASAKAGDNPEVKPGETPAEEKSIADQIAEALGPYQAKVAALETELAEAKRPKKPVETPTVASVLDDEDTAFQQRLTPIMAKQLEIEARIARDDVEKEYRNQGFGDLWEKNRKEIEDTLKGADLVRFDAATNQAVAHRGDPNFIRNVVDMVIGRAARKEGMRYSAKENKFFLEGADGSDPTFIERAKGPGEGLTRKQVEAAKRFGIPTDKYRDAASKLNFVQ